MTVAGALARTHALAGRSLGGCAGRTSPAARRRRGSSRKPWSCRSSCQVRLARPCKIHLGDGLSAQCKERMRLPLRLRLPHAAALGEAGNRRVRAIVRAIVSVHA